MLFIECIVMDLHIRISTQGNSLSLIMIMISVSVIIMIV